MIIASKNSVRYEREIDFDIMKLSQLSILYQQEDLEESGLFIGIVANRSLNFPHSIKLIILNYKFQLS